MVVVVGYLNTTSHLPAPTTCQCSVLLLFLSVPTDSAGWTRAAAAKPLLLQLCSQMTLSSFRCTSYTVLLLFSSQ